MLETRRTRGLRLIFAILTILILNVHCMVAAQEITPQPTPEATTEATAEATPEATEFVFPVANDLTIAGLRGIVETIEGSDILLEEVLDNGENYSRYIASYISDGNKIYGLLTIPFGDIPEGGFKAIVFNHGYIPPTSYVTTERYVAYVDALARAGFVVFKIDMRGHGNSEGEPMGSYYSSAYTIDAITALRSLQRMEFVDPDGIGMWGHSMSGNLVLRAMEVTTDIQAGVIWAGAVYSYNDFVTYGISDTSFVPTGQTSPSASRRREIMETYGSPNTDVPFWQAVSLTENLEYLQSPIQLHHAIDDDTVTVNYSRELSYALANGGHTYEYYEYDNGGHNIAAPSFDLAMERTIAFFQAYL
jgi:dipeptidyl aminopeptidase/acylaminoacyl peptidase